jgi:hypothetical protein
MFKVQGSRFNVQNVQGSRFNVQNVQGSTLRVQGRSVFNNVGGPVFNKINAKVIMLLS